MWCQKQQITQGHFEFLRQEILSKDEFIKYLMGTQTTILHVVTSEKNQEKTQEKKYKI